MRISHKTKSLLAGILVLGFGLASAAAQEKDTEMDFPGSVFVRPNTGIDIGLVAQDDMEVDTDLDIFLRRGYQTAEWIAHEPLVQEVARNLVFPDYRTRTGKEVPDDGMIEIARGMITKQGFQDLIVVSRLPGDCTFEGCLIQIYSLVGETWFKRLEFHATGIAWKDGDNTLTTTVAAVGDSEVPTRLYSWNGTQFVSQ